MAASPDVYVTYADDNGVEIVEPFDGWPDDAAVYAEEADSQVIYFVIEPPVPTVWVLFQFKSGTLGEVRVFDTEAQAKATIVVHPENWGRVKSKVLPTDQYRQWCRPSESYRYELIEVEKP